MCEQIIPNLRHGHDGLVFHPENMAYKAGPCKEMLKWKPGSLNSIDFECQRSGEEHGKAHLYCSRGAERVWFASMEMSETELSENDGQIIECVFDNGKWTFVRKRTDKSLPNAKETADGVWQSILDGIEEEELFEFIDKRVKE